jgi:peptide/nickel transport system substrate-binding protein
VKRKIGLSTISESVIAPELQEAQWAAWRASRRRFLGAGFAAAGGLALAGLPGARLVTSAAAQEGEPVPGGVLYMSLADDDVQNFDPIVPTDNMSIWTMLLIYDQLIRVAADGVSLEPGLAESWDVSEDALTYTFHLRQTNFHDGTPATADDVVYCMNRLVSDETSGWAFLYSAVDTVTAQDPQTVVVTLKQVWVPFESDLALFGASIIPKAAHEAQSEALFQAPIGTGPFTFDSWEKGTSIRLLKNPNYWDAGKPYLDELNFSVLTDANARMLQFQGGDLDIATDVPFSQLDSLRNNPDVTLLTDAVARFDYIGIYTEREPWNDKTLRQAINYAVDKDSIIQNVLFGAGQMANTCLPLMYGHADSVVGYPFDLAKAQELVAQSAGANGFSGTILTDPGDPVGNQVAQLVAANLAEIGGDITIEQLEPGIRRQRVRVDHDYDFSKGYYTTDIIDPDELMTFAVQSDGGTNAIYTFYENPEVDALIKGAQAEQDEAKRLEMYAQVQQMHSDDAPMIFLYYPTGRTAVSNAIKNFRILPTGNYRLWETWRED